MPVLAKMAAGGRRSSWLVVFLPVLAALWISSAAASPADVVKVEILNSLSAYPQGGAYPLALKLTIAPGYYIYSNRPLKPDYIPTEVRFSLPAGLKLDYVAFPQPREHNSAFSEEKVKGFSGTILVRATLTVAEDAARGPQQIRVTLAYQGCSEKACLLPREKAFDFQIKVTPEGEPGKRVNRNIFGKR